MHALIAARRAIGLTALALGVLLGASTAAAQTTAPPGRPVVALVPLDDRPACLTDSQLLGQVADAEVITPPRAVLGRFLKTGDGAAIARWLDGLDLATLDAVIVSTDMLAYGGRAGSRVSRVFETEARERLVALSRLKQRRPDLRVYAFSTLTAPAASADGGKEASRDPRARNHAVNLSLVDLAARGSIDYLIFGEDQTAWDGQPPADRDAIAEAIGKAGASGRTVIVSGTDAIAMLLLTRAMAARASYRPSLRVTYSSTAARDAVMPIDGRPLNAIVAEHVAGAGARLDERGALQLFVYASRHETPDHADAFASRVAQAVAAGGRVIVADVDTTGTADGASLPFTEVLRARRLVPRLHGYASRDTAGNTIGTALSQGVMFALAVDRVAPAAPATGLRVAEAQVRVLLHRLVSDFLYQGVVRGQSIEDFVRPRGLDPSRLDQRSQGRVEKYLSDELRPLVESLTADFAAQPWRLPGPPGRRSTIGLSVKDIEDFKITLPWGRMREAEISFTLSTTSADSSPRPPRPRVLQ